MLCFIFSRNAGVTAVTVANNHLLDFGEKGVNNTLDEIRKFGIKPSGYTIGRKIYKRQVIKQHLKTNT